MPAPETFRPHGQPVLRWAGSKRQLVPLINEHWGEGNRRYVEPFCGSAVAFFQIAPKDAALNDLNADLMNVYAQMRDRPAAVARYVRSFDPSKEAYYEIRAEYRRYRSAAKRAAAFIYLNRLCFNGLYRSNRQGHFNVPYSGLKSGKMPDKTLINEASEALLNAQLSSLDFSEFLYSTVKSGDFVFLDPPYFVEGRRVFREYNSQEFSADDLSRLNECLHMIDSRGATFLLSYAKTAYAKSVFAGWPTRLQRVRRNISGFASNRRFSYELLVSNNGFKR